MGKVFNKIKRLYFFRKNNNVINRHYNKWIKLNEADEKKLEDERHEKFRDMPLVSIVIPTYNPDISYFKALIDSLCSQSYSNIEICIVDGSENKSEEVEKVINVDERIKYKFLNSNRGISENTNEAIKMANRRIYSFCRP